MKLPKKTAVPWILAAALAIGLAPNLSAHPAQAQNPESNTAQQPAQGEKDQKQQAFVGQVIKAQNGKYALLTDKTAGRGYFLDDQTKAKNFDGKTVKVTGTVDSQTKTIHIAEIQPI
jgi:uncharacterized protein DUF5818